MTDTEFREAILAALDDPATDAEVDEFVVASAADVLMPVLVRVVRVAAAAVNAAEKRRADTACRHLRSVYVVFQGYRCVDCGERHR
jgi:hypothetical protein